MGKRTTLSLSLKSDIFYDGAERICSCLKKTERKLAYVASQTHKLDDQRLQLFHALHYKAAMEDIVAETLALRHAGTALRRQVNWWKHYGDAVAQVSASHLMDIVEKYGPFQWLTVRECRTAAETLLRDLGTEQSQADIAAIGTLSATVDQLQASLAILREKQAVVDAAIAASVKPDSMLELKRGIANTVNDIMEYLIGVVKEQPEAYGTLLDQLTTILDNANARKRKATRLVAVAAANAAAQVPA